MPSRIWPADSLVLPRRERRWFVAYIVSFMLFCAANTYSMMQFNSGFRYLLPVLPFIFLQASDALVRLKTPVLAAITVVVLAHGVVLSMAREVNDTEKNLRDRAELQGVSEVSLPGLDDALTGAVSDGVPARVLRPPEDGVQGRNCRGFPLLRQTRPRRPWLRGCRGTDRVVRRSRGDDLAARRGWRARSYAVSILARRIRLCTPRTARRLQRAARPRSRLQFLRLPRRPGRPRHPVLNEAALSGRAPCASSSADVSVSWQVTCRLAAPPTAHIDRWHLFGFSTSSASRPSNAAADALRHA